MVETPVGRRPTRTTAASWAQSRGDYGTTVPSTSGSSVDAELPVMAVKSMVAVATVKMPPPAPILKG